MVTWFLVGAIAGSFVGAFLAAIPALALLVHAGMIGVAVVRTSSAGGYAEASLDTGEYLRLAGNLLDIRARPLSSHHAPTGSRPNYLRGLACPAAQSKRDCRKSGVCRTTQSISAPRGFVNIGARVRLLASACSLRRRRAAQLSRERLDRDWGENFAAPSPGQFQ